MPNPFPIEFRHDVIALARKGQAPLSHGLVPEPQAGSVIRAAVVMGAEWCRIAFEQRSWTRKRTLRTPLL